LKLKSNPRHTHRKAPARSPTSVGILFEDDDLLVVEKPPGLLTIATEKEKHRTLYALLYSYLKGQRPPEKVFIVHRLDREASGLLVFAKRESAKFNLQQQFKGHNAGRTYLAVVEGRIGWEESTFDSCLTENAAFRCYSTRDSRKGKRAVTHVKVLQRGAARTLVEVRLETGRKHQIRVHLAEQGHPIVGDKAYGSRTDPLHRLALHATKLAFRHPRTGEPLEFQSAPAAAFAKLV
jgi:23S rRNA pseudouridine1911/1915/1917 synthase